MRGMSFLKGSIYDVLTLEVDGTNNLTWYINVALSVHADMKIYTGAVFMMEKEASISSSTN